MAAGYEAVYRSALASRYPARFGRPAPQFSPLTAGPAGAVA
jgi:hypothetical protein